MKVLLSLVGKRDPYGDDGSEGSVLTAVRRLAPDRVHLLPNRSVDDAAGTERNAQETAARVQEALPAAQVRIHPLSLVDPTDHGDIGRVLPPAVRDALFGLGPEAEVHCAVSSGTPQLRMMLMLLLQAQGGPVRYWETRAPQFVTETQPRIAEIDVAFLEQPLLTAGFEQAWRMHDFTGAALLMRDRIERSPLAPATPLLGWVADLAEAYARWDAVDWADAHTRLKTLHDKARRDVRVAQLRPLLARQEAVLARLASAQSEDYLTMLDLYHNALRRMEAGQRVDALARWRRVLEGTLYATVRNLPGCGIDQDGRLTLEPAIRRQWEVIRARQFKDASPSADASAGIPDLLIVAQITGRLSNKFAATVEQASRARNKSIAAHGMEAVPEGIVRSALRELREVLTAVFPDEAASEPVDGYSFSADAMRDLGNSLVRLLGPPA